MYRNQFAIDHEKFDVYGSLEKKLYALSKIESDRFLTIYNLIRGTSEDESEYSCFEIETGVEGKYQIKPGLIRISGKQLEIIFLK